MAYEFDLSSYPWLETEEDKDLAQAQFRKVMAAKIRLQKTQPFFHALISRLNLIPLKNHEQLKTAAVDAKGNVLFDIDFFSGLTLAETEGVLAHEVMHVALLHLLRVGGRNPQVMNIAQDIKVNGILDDANLKLPDMAINPAGEKSKLVLPKTIKNYNQPDTKEVTLHGIGKGGKDIVIKKIEEKTAEEIYAEILPQLETKDSAAKLIFDGHSYGDQADGEGDNNEGNGNGNGEVPGFGGELSEEDTKTTAREWKQAIATAAAHARQRGNLPGGIEGMIDELLEPKINWRHRLQRMLTQEIPFDYTWTRPHKKSLGCGFYVPGVKKERLEVVVTLDTSGSMSDDDLRECFTEMVSLAEQFENIQMHVIVFDSQIHAVYDLDTQEARDAAENVKVIGRGGTDHTPVGEYIAEELPNTRIVLNFTDLCTCIPEERIGTWIWICPDDRYVCKDTCPEDEELIIMQK